mmetsp:Transcript_129442/g.252041  ORF Transcript_129442/g.252041 Transcript_129442/m.252041 type:complete len:87 (+) Transcript_129442:782-1042(+)
MLWCALELIACFLSFSANLFPWTWDGLDSPANRTMRPHFLLDTQVLHEGFAKCFSGKELLWKLTAVPRPDSRLKGKRSRCWGSNGS